MTAVVVVVVAFLGVTAFLGVKVGQIITRADERAGITREMHDADQAAWLAARAAARRGR